MQAFLTEIQSIITINFNAGWKRSTDALLPEYCRKSRANRVLQACSKLIVSDHHVQA